MISYIYRDFLMIEICFQGIILICTGTMISWIVVSDNNADENSDGYVRYVGLSMLISGAVLVIVALFRYRTSTLVERSDTIDEVCSQFKIV
jgi:hypothetical protein